MMHLDEPSRTKLEALVDHFNIPKADIIRQLIAQATPDDFPKRWQIRANERHIQQARQILPW
jgi:hypothetical protein